MGSYDRDYMRGSGYGGSSYRDSYSTETHRLIWILIGVNVGIFLLGYFVPQIFFTEGGSRAGGISRELIMEGQVWRFFTFPFVHGHLLHVGFNMLLLYFFGKPFLNAKGVNQFVIVYVMGSLIGGALELLVSPNAYLFGASGSVLALLSAFCWLRPKEVFQGYFMFVIPFRMRFQTLALIILGIDVVMFLLSLGRTTDGVAHMAHIGGWLYGWAHVNFLSAGRISFPKARAKRSSSKTVPYHRRSENPNIIEAEFTDGKPDYNAILDKINREGMSALTEEERRILEQASESMKDKNPS